MDIIDLTPDNISAIEQAALLATDPAEFVRLILFSLGLAS